jgi:hypothetical protein
VENLNLVVVVVWAAARRDAACGLREGKAEGKKKREGREKGREGRGREPKARHLGGR